MGVTISPANNLAFCEERKLVVIQKEDCLCEENHRKNCHYCNGTGFFTEKIYPYELNVSNSNFSTLWGALGLDKQDWCGTISAQELLGALARVDESLILRANYVDGNFYSFGIDNERVAYYLNKLREILVQCLARNVDVFWC